MVFEIVVGIDFGTTHSGVSWAVSQGDRKIRLIKDWPNPNSTVADAEKVPTIISYNNGQPSKWGYDVKLNEQSFRWFKLLLDPSHREGTKAEAVMSSKKLLSTLNKTAEEVAADYLRLLWRYTEEDIRNRKGENWKSTYTLKVVFTVPAIWAPVANDRTLKVARAAGLPDTILLVAEPEAAALRVLNQKHDEEQPMKLNDVFIVCDAGGGTVDLISYKITGVKPLQMEECAIGDGSLCGSVFIDAAFEKQIKVLVGEQQYASINEKAKVNMRRDFEMGVKRMFSGDDRDYSVDLMGVETNEKENIYDDTIQLKPSSLKTIFDHVINPIVALIEKQIAATQRVGLGVKTILLVGGFGANRYMHQRLRDEYGTGGIQVLQADNAWSSVCIGATMWGLENSEQSTASTVNSRLARHSYGQCLNVPFDATKGHQASDGFRNERGSWLAKEQMKWLLRKGERIHVGSKLTSAGFWEVQTGWWISGGSKSFVNTLWYCKDDEPPSRLNARVKKLCTVEFAVDRRQLWWESTFTNPDTKETWRAPNFDFEVHLDNTILVYKIFYKGKLVGRKEAKYVDVETDGDS